MKTNNFIISLFCACALSLSAGEMYARGDGARGGNSSSTQTRNTKPAPLAQPSKPATHQSGNALSPTPHRRGQVQTGTINKKLPPSRVSPSANYKKLPPRGAVVSKRKAIKHAHVVRHSGVDYYFKNGIFYRYNSGNYIVSRPPIGIRVATIPTPRVVWVNNVKYYYYYGTFYNHVTITNEYEVIKPPLGAIVESIPDGYEKIEIDGNTYYVVDGVQYKAVVYEGEIWYEVIKVD